MAVYFQINDVPRLKNAVLTIGTFDGVHLGHKTILDKMLAHTKSVDGESVLLTFEPHPRKVLFPDQPLKIITPLQQKLELISQAGIEHIVVVPFTPEFAQLSAREYITDFLIEKFHPRCIVIGYDHHFGHDRAGNIDMLKEYKEQYGYDVFEISAQLIDEAAVSSTKIRKALDTGDVAVARQMLGRDFGLRGTVISGAQLGRTIGFPTANIRPDHIEQIIPAKGVYAVNVLIDGTPYPAMMNIGNRPTVTKEIALHIEAHIFNFEKDIYHQSVEVQFVERMRDEQKFDSLDALKAQLQKDKVNAQAILGVN
jgi:riboflavin kinase/FMN adenylyltransferase